MEQVESDLKEAQLQLAIYRDRLNRFFEQAPAAICVLDGPDMIFEMANPLYQSLFSGRDLLGKSVWQALPEIVGTPIQKILENVYCTGQTYEGKELLLNLARVEGGPLEPMYFNFIYQARLNIEKEVDGILVFAYEITEHVLARLAKEQLAAKIEQQAKTFDVVLAAIKDFVYTFDTSGRFTFSNKPLLDLLGITLEEIIGKNFHDLPYPEALAARLQSQIAQVIAEGKPISDETPYTNPEGKVGYYEYIFSPIFNNKGQVILVAGSTRDISERKKSEESIRLKNEELIKINSDLDNFIYTASHDLKAPISNIEGLITALRRYLSKESLENPLVIKLMSMIQSSIERFKQTLLDLTEIVKFQRAADESIENIDIRAAIDGIKLDLFSIIYESNTVIEVDSKDCPSVQFSRKNFRSILYNLISNSIKYRSKERSPIITITCKTGSDFYIISVKDNGIGMNLKSQTSIFGMFKRLHNHVDGTGIGLYIVKKIIDNSGGKIEVESTPDVGSTFSVYLKKNAIV